MPITAFIIIAAAYVVGSIPTGVIVARALGGPDPRKGGSGNIGATNVGRTLGRAAGAATLFGDALKGALPVLAALYVLNDPFFLSLVGFFAFLGHLFPVFLGFKGGKGVATACGVLAVISPLALLFSASVFAFFVYTFRYVSLGSIMAAVSLPLFLLLLEDPRYVNMGIFMAVLIVIKHAENIKRLRAGAENRIGKGKR